MKIAVVGAGIVGTLTAYEFASRGHKVHVFEAESDPAAKCSHANGGQISVCNAQTWNTWENVAKGLKWMMHKDAPLLIRPTPSLKKIAWIAGFLKHTINGSHVQNTIDTIHMGQLSSAIYDDIIRREELEFDQSKCGLLHIYSKQESFDKAAKLQSFFENQDVEWKPLDSNAVRELDPTLNKFVNLKGGILTSTDWTGDARKFCVALQKRMRKKFGARFFFGAEISRVFSGNLIWGPYMASGFDHVILANGHDITKFARVIGDWLNVYPVKGYSVTIDNVGSSAPNISLLDDDRKIVSSKLGNRLRIAGTAELAGENYDITQSRIDPLIAWCNENFPEIDTSSYTPWACLRPMNSNMMPIMRQSLEKGVWYHGGHGHLGWTLAAGTARILADKVESGI